MHTYRLFVQFSFCICILINIFKIIKNIGKCTHNTVLYHCRVIGKRITLLQLRHLWLTLCRTSGAWYGKGSATLLSCWLSWKRENRYSLMVYIWLFLYLYFNWHKEMVQLLFHVWSIHAFTSFPTTLTPGEVCTLLASRGQRFIWRVCTGAEERHTLWDFQHSRHAAVICISELNVQWIWPFHGPSFASLTLGASFLC